ncbi:SGNH/GDSL hydrolase family protein [Sinomonas sp. P10A9]|uniref:SGNH/GDSL hydrolase family protein n=1 Tax=Sinomonas puerhi TaxID=3238584 RepID=A0AB39L2S8_9MICC
MTSLFRRTAASFVAVAALVFAGAAVPASAAPPSPLNYVNFGDSYSAGWGAEPFVLPPAVNPDLQVPTCRIGGRPDQVTKFSRLNSVSLQGDYACAGATIGAPTDPNFPVPTIGQQIGKAALDGTLNASTDIVTLTAGGNDVGFVKFVETCAADTTPTAVECQAFAKAGDTAADNLAVQATIDEIHQVAPHAEVAWIGYPHIFALAGEPTTVLPGGGVMSAAAAAVFDAATTTLNETLAKKVGAADHAMFVDVTAKFTGHEVGSSDSWFALFAPSDPRSRFNLHPTTTGYAEGYFPAMVSQIKPAQLVRR